jgi:hypothetical protein
MCAPGLCAENIATLELHIGRAFECAIIRDDTPTSGVITARTSPVFITNPDIAPLSHRMDTAIQRVVQKK